MKRVKQNEKIMQIVVAGLSKILSVVSVDAGCDSMQ